MKTSLLALGFVTLVAAPFPALAVLAAADPSFIHLKIFDHSGREEKCVITTAGIVRLGELLAQSYLEHK